MNYRPATLDDAELASDLMTAAYPARPADPVLTRLLWEQPRRGYAFGRFIVESAKRPVGYVSWGHAPWEDVPERSCQVEVWIDRARMADGLLVDATVWISERASEEGSRLLAAYAAEDELELLAALEKVGYHRERVERVWELDLSTNGARIIGEAREADQAMRREGIRCITLAEWHDSERFRKLYELNEATMQDVPHTLTIPPSAYEDFVKRLSTPDRPHDRLWVALDGDRPVALSYLRFPPVRGPVWTGYTCTDRRYRGRGIARAIKLQSLAQAAELGVPAVGTDNDGENAPILRLNERLGYQRQPGYVELHKRVTNTGHA
ncbi:MAG TPA: GNAT family N-acetyltransferase [Candidatus Dormibacteraeota bacterium]|nr:GNAT family N-acetyltransferase [Candidatus Dormibacteraeota bacterium]